MKTYIGGQNQNCALFLSDDAVQPMQHVLGSGGRVQQFLEDPSIMQQRS